MSVGIEGSRLPIPSAAPVSLKRLIQDCWRSDPRLRPSFEEILVRVDQIAEKHARKG